jgi:hypothetical protein
MTNQNQPDSLFKSRSLVNTVNHHMPFSYARKLGFDPKKAYFLVQDFGFTRVKEVFDFYVSIHMVNPSFFWFKQNGEVDGQDNKQAEAERFCRYIYSTIKQRKPIHTKFAGPHYFNEGWGAVSGFAPIAGKHPVEAGQR